jgi:hypothetical protein
MHHSVNSSEVLRGHTFWPDDRLDSCWTPSEARSGGETISATGAILDALVEAGDIDVEVRARTPGAGRRRSTVGLRRGTSPYRGGSRAGWHKVKDPSWTQREAWRFDQR